jgi:hypothetical protein
VPLPRRCLVRRRTFGRLRCARGFLHHHAVLAHDEGAASGARSPRAAGAPRGGQPVGRAR